MAGVFGFCGSPSLLIAILLFTGTVVPSLSNVDGQIDTRELQRALTASGIAGSYQSFSKATCKVLILMLDHDRSGMMGFNEFKELWNVLNQWKASFLTTDRDRSGTLEPHELHHALLNFGYNLSPNALGAIIRRFAVNGRISLDDYILCSIRLRTVTDHFKMRDTSRNGHANFQYDDFIQVVMSV
ncbi:sorcin-like isoform X2 [Acanthaster planci]|uniref:Sorcin-like isoform X2 n=1 Tax=Acanthaster planci TaxID=133434 RepID=A0A8B7Z4Z7_ACAPL|nr:sorcin-like isoform X2 [Acanthaster planci]